MRYNSANKSITIESKDGCYSLIKRNSPIKENGNFTFNFKQFPDLIRFLMQQKEIDLSVALDITELVKFQMEANNQGEKKDSETLTEARSVAADAMRLLEESSASTLMDNNNNTDSNTEITHFNFVEDITYDSASPKKTFELLLERIKTYSLLCTVEALARSEASDERIETLFDPSLAFPSDQKIFRQSSKQIKKQASFLGQLTSLFNSPEKKEAVSNARTPLLSNNPSSNQQFWSPPSSPPTAPLASPNVVNPSTDSSNTPANSQQKSTCCILI